MSKGFAIKNSSPKEKNKSILYEPKGRLISWSPWPPKDFQTRYPAFPLFYNINNCSFAMVYFSFDIIK